MGATRRGAIRGRFRRDQRAVSPVIGTVLVLFIVLVAMAGILAWGVPAIQGLQDHAEYRSVLTQMIQADQDLRVLRDPQNTRVLSISMNQGSLAVQEGSRWVITAHLDAAYTPYYLDGWEDSASTTLTLRGLPGASAKNVTIDRVQGGTFTNSVTDAACVNDCAETLTYGLDDNVTRIQVRDAGVLKAETWIVEAGRLTYRLTETDTINRAHIEMGAVIAQQHDALFLEETPTIKEPDFTVDPQDSSYIFRIIQMDGNSTASGKGRHSVLAHLVDNYGITRGRPSLPDAVSVRVQIDDGGAAGTTGILESGFCNQFLRADHYTEANADCADGDVNVLYDPPDGPSTNDGRFSFELSHAVVNLLVRPF